MYVKELKEFLQKHDIESNVVKYFYEYFNSYRDEESEEFNEVYKNYDLSKIETCIYSVILRRYNWPEFDYCNIVITLRVKCGDKKIGDYKLFYELNGEIVDDMLV